MADRFLVVDGPATNRHGPGFFLDRTKPRTVGTRLLVTEELELAAEDLFDGPAGQGLGHVDCQRFDRVEIQIESRPDFAEGAARDDFSPAIDQVAQLGPILGLILGERHRSFILELGIRGKLGNRP